MLYLDHNATTPLAAEARRAIMEAVIEAGNPASLHAEGRAKRRCIEAGRQAVRRLVAAPVAQVVLTASGTEADNLAVFGLARRRRREGCDQVVVTAIEHPAVLSAASALANEGFRVSRVPVDRLGRVDLGALAGALSAQVAVVAVMLANNETGVVQPVAEAAALAARHGVPLHVDAVQAAGKMPVNFPALGAATLAISAHKLGGPRGIGALVMAKGVEMQPLWHGGGQEHGLRSGSQPAALAAGLAAAADQATTLAAAPAIARRRDRLQDILAQVPGAFVVAAAAPRLPNTLSVGFDGVPSHALVDHLSSRGIMVSAGAACHAGGIEPSAVLLAMGLTTARASEAIRISLGADTSDEEIVLAASAVREAVASLRAA